MCCEDNEKKVSYGEDYDYGVKHTFYTEKFCRQIYRMLYLAYNEKNVWKGHYEFSIDSSAYKDEQKTTESCPRINQSQKGGRLVPKTVNNCDCFQVMCLQELENILHRKPEVDAKSNEFVSGEKCICLFLLFNSFGLCGMLNVMRIFYVYFDPSQWKIVQSKKTQ